ncbi:hypothetical protein ACLOJK_024234 [Asimina triloba]
MKKSSRAKEKKATLDAYRDEVFGIPYGGGGDDDDDDNKDDIDIAMRESLHSPYFQVFVDAAAEALSGVKAPSSYEIDGKYAEIVYDEI